MGLKRSEDHSTRLHLPLCDSKCNLNVNVEMIIPGLPICRVDVRTKILNERISEPKTALGNSLFFKR